MNAARKIYVFEIGSNLKNLPFEDGEIFFLDKKSPIHLATGDIIIYQVGSFNYYYIPNPPWGDNLAPIPDEAIRREKELISAIEKGKIVCIIGSRKNDYVVDGLLKTCSIYSDYFQNGEIQRKLEVKRSEFKTFIDDVGATSLFFSSNGIDEQICFAPHSALVGFSKKIGNGKLIFIPCLWGSKELPYVTKYLLLLAKSLVTYSAKRALEPPSFISNFKFSNEKSTSLQIDEIMEKQLKPLHNKMNRYSVLKKILWLGDNELVNAISKFLTETGLKWVIDEQFEEDLWITNEKEKLIIVEVKGLNNNLTRQDISKLDEHREARQVPDLTGLLIANTFMRAGSIQEKEIDFPPNVIDKAVNANLLITRTLDLCRIYDLMEMNNLPAKFLLDQIVCKKGWLTCDSEKIKIVT